MTTWAMVFAVIVVGITAIAVYKKPSSIYRGSISEKNPFEGKMVKFVEDDNDPMNADGVCGHLETVGEVQHTPSFYEKFIKRGLDIILSFLGLIILSPLFVFLILAIVIDDPGPVFFIQRRVGKNKRFFIGNKFRTVGTHKNRPCLAA